MSAKSILQKLKKITVEMVKNGDWYEQAVDSLSEKDDGGDLEMSDALIDNYQDKIIKAIRSVK